MLRFVLGWFWSFGVVNEMPTPRRPPLSGDVLFKANGRVLGSALFFDRFREKATGIRCDLKKEAPL